MPFIWGLEGNFRNWPSLDSWYWCVLAPYPVFYPCSVCVPGRVLDVLTFDFFGF